MWHCVQWLLHDQLQPPKINSNPFKLVEFVGIFVLNKPFQIDVAHVYWNQPHPHIQHQSYFHQALKGFDTTLYALWDILYCFNYLVHSTSTLRVNPTWLWMCFETQLMDTWYGNWRTSFSWRWRELCWCLDLHEAFLQTIEYAYVVKLDSKHCLYVWGLIDHFL